MGGSSLLGSVGRHSTETTEINRGGEWAGVPPNWASATGGGASTCSPAPHPPSPARQAPQGHGTDTKHPASWLSGKDYNVGMGAG